MRSFDLEARSATTSLEGRSQRARWITRRKWSARAYRRSETEQRTLVTLVRQFVRAATQQRAELVHRPSSSPQTLFPTLVTRAEFLFYLHVLLRSTKSNRQAYFDILKTMFATLANPSDCKRYTRISLIRRHASTQWNVWCERRNKSSEKSGFSRYAVSGKRKRYMIYEWYSHGCPSVHALLKYSAITRKRVQQVPPCLRWKSFIILSRQLSPPPPLPPDFMVLHFSRQRKKRNDINLVWMTRMFFLLLSEWNFENKASTKNRMFD